MATLPPESISATVAAIYRMYEGKRDPSPRRYLGASIVGRPCARALWYEFRWCGREEFDGRMLRLFESGNLEEIRLIHNLRDIGVTVETGPAPGEQFSIAAHGGHFGGHLDGACIGLPEAPATWHVLECKTMKLKLFAQLVAHGVEKSKPEHFAQMQIYMYLTEMERALYLVTCKDSDEIYAERVKYDRAAAEAILAKAGAIIFAAQPPERAGENPESFVCKWCAHRPRCWHDSADVVAPHGVNCRTCCHATPRDNGTWGCEKFGKVLSEQEQAKGCESHLFIPDLLEGCNVVDGCPDWVEYETEAGKKTKFRNGKGKGEYRSVELTVLTGDALADDLVNRVKQMGASVCEISFTNTRSPENGSTPALFPADPNAKS